MTRALSILAAAAALVLGGTALVAAPRPPREAARARAGAAEPARALPATDRRPAESRRAVEPVPVAPPLLGSKALAGRVVDAQDSAVDGACVAAARPGGSEILVSAAAGADGAFELRGLDDGPFTLIATAPGRATAKLVDVVPDGSPRRLVLGPAAAVSGFVVDARGAPVEGAAVAVARITAGGLEESTDGGCDPAGRFRFDDVAAGGLALVLQASAPGFATQRVTLSAARPGEERDQGFVLEPSVDLRVRVLDLDGAPIAGAWVEAHGASDRAYLGGAETAAGGAVRLPGASASRRYRVLAKAPGRELGAAAEADPREIVAIRLAPSFALEGSLADAAGSPREGRVRLRRESDREIVVEEREALALADGRFRFDDLGAGLVHLLVESPGFAPRAAGPFAVGAGAPAVRVELSAGATWTGRLRDARGAPIAGARVAAPSIAPASGRVRGTAGEPALSDGDGRFELRHVPASAPGLVVGSRFVRVAARADAPPTRDFGEIRIPEPGRVRGRVIDGAGRPVEGVAATLAGDDAIADAAPRAVTGADGAFEIDDVAPGRYSLDLVDPAESALAGGFRRTTVDLAVRPGATAVVTVDARERGRVHGRVRVRGASAAEPLEVALVAADGSARERSAAGVGLDASYALTAPHGGLFAIEIRSLSGPVVRAARLVELAPRESRELDLDVGLAGVAGRVVRRATREPVAGARVQIATEGGARWSALAGPDGRFEVTGLPEGAVTLRALGSGCAPSAPLAARLRDGETARAEIEVDAQATVALRVRSDAGRPVAGARVSVGAPDGTALGAAETDALGETAVAALPPGRAIVIVSHEAHETLRLAWELDAEARPPRDVTLARVARIVASVRDELDRPAPFVDVRATGAGGETRVAATDASGLARLELRAEGRFRVEAAGCAPAGVDARLGATASVTLRP